MYMPRNKAMFCYIIVKFYVGLLEHSFQAKVLVSDQWLEISLDKYLETENGILDKIRCIAQERIQVRSSSRV